MRAYIILITYLFIFQAHAWVASPYVYAPQYDLLNFNLANNYGLLTMPPFYNTLYQPNSEFTYPYNSWYGVPYSYSYSSDSDGPQDENDSSSEQDSKSTARRNSRSGTLAKGLKTTVESTNYLNVYLKDFGNVAGGCSFNQDNPPLPPKDSWKNGCEVLASKITQKEKSKLTQCLDSIRKVIVVGAVNSRGRVDRKSLFKNMFKRLNSYEQRFLAMIYTSFGEARGLRPVRPNLIKVMKVLHNRKRDANRRGLKQYNELDAALQPWQFSMYNQNDVNWRKAIGASPRSSGMQDSIDAFIQFQDEKFIPMPQADRVYHYHTKSLRGQVNWSDNQTPIPFRPEEQNRPDSRRGHDFFSDIAWAPQYSFRA